MKRNIRAAVAATGAVAAATLGAVALLGPVVGSASSHREAPYIAGQPRVDNTDVYAFVSPDKKDTVTLVANWIPFEEPNGGPNFYAFEAGSNYDINIDNDGDAVADLTYRWVFKDNYRTQDTFLYNTGAVTSLKDKDLNFFQTYDLYLIRDGRGRAERLVHNAIAAPSFVGPASMPAGYQPLRDQAIVPVKGGGQTYSGQADDSFFLDLRIFDLLYGGAVEEGSPPFPEGVDFVEDGHDTLAGYNVNTIALQVPKAALALNGDAKDNPVVGVWSDTERPRVTVLSRTDGDGGVAQAAGNQVQVSRLGNPLVNEVVIPIKDKDRFNSSTPSEDGQFLQYVQEPIVPSLVEAIYGIPAPATPRTDLVEVFLTGICAVEGCPETLGDINLNSQLLNKDVDPRNFAPGEMIRLNMSIPPTSSYAANRLGVLGGDLAGFPNGRRLADDVVDIELQVLEGELVGTPNELGDAVSSNDKEFGNKFPYVAIPHSNSVNVPGDDGPDPEDGS